MLSTYLEGLLLQAGLIFALGPQNLFVLESGLRREHPFFISTVCFLCDLTLIMTGVLGAATVLAHFPEFKIVIGVLGVFFLIRYGIQKLLSTEELGAAQARKMSTKKQVFLNAVTFSIVNPHAYLDGIVLIGGYSSKYPDLHQRLALGLGASSFSFIWFLTLSFGAGLFLPFFKNREGMKILMTSAGLVLLYMSVKLSFDVYGWIYEFYPGTLAFGK
jgi:L-lysine exporter family protein LysE/ArgO